MSRQPAMRAVVKHLSDAVALVRGLRRDQRVPRRVKTVLAIAAASVVSPIDVIPDFIPIIGQLDDAAALLFALRYAAKHIPRDAFDDHWRGDPKVLDAILRFASRGL